MTLTNLEKVSASLGAKAVLWELFSFNPPTLAALRRALRDQPVPLRDPDQQPGDDRRPDGFAGRRPAPAGAAIKAELAELCRGAEDLAPILSSFRNKEWVRIGTRDILGREPIRDVTRELADVAEAIVIQVAQRPVGPPGRAVRHAPARRRRPARSLGDRRPGQVRRPRAELSQRPRPDLPPRGRRPRPRAGTQSVSNEQFVTEVVQRVLKALAERLDRPARSTRSTPGSGPTAPRARWS